jgi:NitT/TauT family transport system ATP-binding protein
MENGLKLVNITKRFQGMDVIDDLSLHIPRNKITCILGPSGCGKTTLLKMIAGLLEPDHGQIHFSEEGAAFSFVFQEDRLLPWRNVRDNIKLILQNSMNPDLIDEMIEKNLERVGMAAYATYYPHQLSGGMRQRVSFVRAFSYPSKIVLLDEPFQGIDLPRKKQLMENVRTLLREDPRTVVFVTHIPEEGIYFSDRIVLLSAQPARMIQEYDHINDATSGTQKEALLRTIKKQLEDHFSNPWGAGG